MASDCTLIKSRLNDGVWEGVLTLDGEFDAPPVIAATYLEKPIDGLEVRPGDRPGLFDVTLHLPKAVLSDGSHVIQFVNSETDEHLASETILAGDTLAEDIRADVALLRSELDMLKRAFRRHCVETM